MKLAAIIGTAFVSATACALAQSDQSSEPESRQVCAVEGANEARSKMYEPSEEGDVLMELERSACWRLASGNPNNETNFYKDGLTFVDGGPVLYGANEAKDYFSQFRGGENDFLTWEPVEAHVSASKDLGWVFGLYVFQPEGQEVERGKYITIWEKIDDTWQVVGEIRNPF